MQLISSFSSQSIFFYSFISPTIKYKIDLGLAKLLKSDHLNRNIFELSHCEEKVIFIRDFIDIFKKWRIYFNHSAA
jgi:hypothetical protein